MLHFRFNIPENGGRTGFRSQTDPDLLGGRIADWEISFEALFRSAQLTGELFCRHKLTSGAVKCFETDRGISLTADVSLDFDGISENLMQIGNYRL